MMFRLAVVAALVLAPFPALAAGFPLTVQNNSSHAVTSVAAFAVDAAGTPLEDNLGSLVDPVPAGASSAFDLSISACQNVALIVTLDDATELRTVFDTCKNGTLILTD